MSVIDVLAWGIIYLTIGVIVITALFFWTVAISVVWQAKDRLTAVILVAVPTALAWAIWVVYDPA